MHTEMPAVPSAFYLFGGICVLCFASVIYALSRGHNVKASLKVWFAVFTFETEGAESKEKRVRKKP